MNTNRPNSLATRPPYIRQISDASSIEMASRAQDRAAAQPLENQSPRGSTTLNTDMFEQGPTFGVPRPSIGGLLGHPAQPTYVGTQSRLGHALSVTRQTAGAHWRDLTVGTALTAIVSWAIWATVRINRGPDIPYCIIDDVPQP